MTEPRPPVCWIIAGPNGAGKTTFALKFLPEVAGCRYFVNADLIAAGMSPLAPERDLVAASRLYLAEVERHVAARHDFALETTLAGRGHLPLMARLKQAGWRVELIYLALPSVEMSKLRVAERVAHGGHDIPLAAIERRFSRSLGHLFSLHPGQVDRIRCFLNSGDAPMPVFIQRAGEREILDADIFAQLQREAGT